MANVKKLGTSKIAAGSTAYCIVRREVDGYRLDDSDGSFAAAPADPYLSLSEDSIIKGLYEVSESRTAWVLGRYKVFCYKQSGGSPVPASDILEEELDFFIVGDSIVVVFPFEAGAVVADALNTATTFETDLPSAISNYCVGSFLKFVSGTLINQQRRIQSYNGTSKFIVLVSAFTGTPSGDDEFFIVNQ